MNIKKLQVSKEKLEINLQFYFFLKYIVKIKLSNKKILLLLENYNLFKKSNIEIIIEKFLEILIDDNKPSKNNKSEQIAEIFSRIESVADIELFIFSIKLYQIKDLLLQEAKTSDVVDISKLEKLDPLSLNYDRISVLRPYATRVSGALLALLFFEKLERSETNFMSENSHILLEDLSEKTIALKKRNLEPNQIFMLMFSESINQSILSDSGSNYEDRILSVLVKNNIKDIKKTHDKNDASTEFDFFFSLNGRSYGIGAKRTLRERYKQFIKTAQMSNLDVMIGITLGLDLNEEKAKTILKHGVYMFVSDEIYQSRKFLQNLDGIYSVKDLNAKTLVALE